MNTTTKSQRFLLTLFIVTLMLIAGYSASATQAQSPINCALSTDVPQAECQALVDLYNSTNGANWNLGINWLTINASIDVCDWIGVTCNSGSVEHLNLYGKQLSGAIPSSLGNLSNLGYLDLANNQLNGTIPSSLGNLSNLSHINLYDNQLSGTIPSSLGNLSSLYWLKLDDNQLSGTIPSSLGNLSNLQFLYLDNNQLSGEIPISLSNLSNIQYIYLSGNQLCLPNNSTFVTWLSLNGITSALNYPPCSQVQVCVDDLFEPNDLLSAPATLAFPSINNLAACVPPLNSAGSDVYQFNVPPTIAGSMKITFTTGATSADIMLDTYDSSLNIASTHSFSIPASTTEVHNITSVAFTDINTIISLNFDNDFQYDLELMVDNQSPSLTGLSFNVTQTTANGTAVGSIIGTDPDGDTLAYSIVGGNTGSAFTINPSSGAITVANNSGFATTSLYSLVVQATDPSGLTATATVSINIIQFCATSLDVPQAECQALVDLYNSADGSNWVDNTNWLTINSSIDVCDWYGINCFGGNVSGLYLSANQLSGTIPASLGNLSNLFYMYLFGNQLGGAIPSTLGNLSNLNELYLGDNLLSGAIPASLGNLSNLTFLSLDENQLSGVIPASLGNLSNLDGLLLYDNQLSGEIPVSLANIVGLSTLALSQNQLCLPNSPSFVSWLTSLDTISANSYSTCSTAVYLPIVVR